MTEVSAESDPMSQSMLDYTQIWWLLKEVCCAIGDR